MIFSGRKITLRYLDWKQTKESEFSINKYGMNTYKNLALDFKSLTGIFFYNSNFNGGHCQLFMQEGVSWQNLCIKFHLFNFINVSDFKEMQFVPTRISDAIGLYRRQWNASYSVAPTNYSRHLFMENIQYVIHWRIAISLEMSAIAE